MEVRLPTGRTLGRVAADPDRLVTNLEELLVKPETSVGVEYLELWRSKAEAGCATSLGAGVSGQVFRTCKGQAPNCSECIAVKISKPPKRDPIADALGAARARESPRSKAKAKTHDESRYEAQMLALLTREVPGLTPRYFDFARSRRFGGMIAFEYVAPHPVAGATVERFLRKASADAVRRWYPAVLAQVLFTLGQIQRRVPGFRHNDLLCRNVLLTPMDPGGRVLRTSPSTALVLTPDMPSVRVADFGGSTCRQLVNPAIALGLGDFKDEAFQAGDSHYFDALGFLVDSRRLLAERVEQLVERVDLAGPEETSFRRMFEDLEESRRRLVGGVKLRLRKRWMQLNAESQRKLEELRRSNAIPSLRGFLERDPFFARLRRGG